MTKTHTSTLPSPSKSTRNPAPVLKIAWKTLESIIGRIGLMRAETGGPLGGAEGEEVVTHFHFDQNAQRSSVTYSPDHELLNRLFKTEWNPQKIRLKGFVHSHPGGYSQPSHGDEVYAKNILQAIPDLSLLWLPIVNTVPETGQFLLTPWAARLEGGKLEIIRGMVQLVGAPEKSRAWLMRPEIQSLFEINSPQSEILITDTQQSAPASLPAPKPRRVDPAMIGSTFERVRSAYDLPVMHGSRLIAVGAGGAAEWLEQLARAGLGQFVLIDHDTVSETNLATQQTYRRDIGRPKVDCIAERIRDINPSATVLTIPKSLDDLSDEDIARLATEPIAGTKTRRTVIAGLTDNFWAQARVNRLALQFGLPSLNAQVYREGRGAEVTFTYPGVTPACHRCILSLRYRYFLEQQGENDVTSYGTPIFATGRVNATKGFVLLAMLHHGSSHPRWGNMLSRIGQRNMAVIRMDPDFSESIGMKVFDKVFKEADGERILWDETLWLPQKQNCPETGHSPCPDCGGTGDLNDAIGTIRNTVLVFPEAPQAEAGNEAAQAAESSATGVSSKIIPGGDAEPANAIPRPRQGLRVFVRRLFARGSANTSPSVESVATTTSTTISNDEPQPEQEETV